MTNESQKIWSLYCITNLINNKVYIGQAADISKRWSDHRRAFKLNKPTQAIHFAFIKYGLENFQFEIIATCKGQDNANYLETELVSQYDSYIGNNKGYNLTLGGMNAPKSDIWKQSFKEWRDSLSEEEKKAIAKKQSDATIKQIETKGHPAQGHKWTEEQKTQLSETLKALDKSEIYTEEVRQRMSESHIGYKDSDEVKEKKALKAKLAWKKRQDLALLSGELKCNAPGCDANGIRTYLLVNNIRYCGKHGQRLKLKGTLDLKPR
jgi:group I intron endonuclease